MQSERPWLQSYPPGVPAAIDADAYPSLVAVMREACDRFATLPAYSSLGTTLSYADLDRLSADLASYFVNVLKLRRGERVALMMPNVLQYPVAVFAALRAGLTVVNTNPMYTARELRHQLHDTGAVAVIVIDLFAHTLAEALHDTPVRQVIVTGMGDLLRFPKRLLVDFTLRHITRRVPDYEIAGVIGLRQALALGARQPLPEVFVSREDLAFLQYTGGTTGIAKGAMLSHRNLIANMQQASAWVGGGLEAGREVIVTALPLYHIFALTANCLTFMKFGAHNHLVADPRDLRGLVKVLARSGFTAFTGVNTLFNALLDTPGFAQLDFSRLKIALGGASQIQRAVAERWKAVTGVELVEAYGLTEASPAVCINPLGAPRAGAIGLPLPSTACCVKDEDGQALAVGEIGELCARGPQVMSGYWNQPEETAKVLDAEGWLHTGDIARMDPEGFFYIVDRKKDMILVSGFNVYPNEIEDVIATMPGVHEVGAVGVPDARSGEVVKVVIVRRDPKLTVEQVKAFCHERLTGYKRPHQVEFRDFLPKSNIGKILRRELRETVAPPAPAPH